MQPSIQKLQKFFKLEADMGFNNRAVIGGFDQLAPSWEAEARADNIPEDLVQAVSDRLRNYDSLSPSSRQETLQGLWRRIQRSLDVSTETVFEATKIEQETETKSQHESVQQPASSDEHKNKKPITNKQDQLGSIAQDDESITALDAPVTTLKGVGNRIAQTLERLGIFTLRDMLYYFPRRYVDYSKLKPINRLWYGEEVTVIGSIENVQTRSIKGGKLQIIEALLGDGSGKIRLTWFNQPWIVQRLQRNPHISVSGKIEQYLGRLVIYNPEWEPLTQQQLHTNRIVPVYPLTAKITQTWLRRQMNSAVSFWAPRLKDPLPDDFRSDANLMDLSNAVSQTHWPDSIDLLQAARHRLAFDEIFYLQLGVLSQKRQWENREAKIYSHSDEWLRIQINRLPYQLTNAQKKAIQEIRTDLQSGSPMNRLLQGDVGSGKTIVAALTISMIVKQGSQAAIMAPTSILAAQHYQSLSQTLIHEGNLSPGEIRLLIGSTSESEKQEIRQALYSGEIKVIVGTHSLIEDPVEFADLQLAVIDEQHRFGVEQRAILRSKGTNPHLLVMTATPIPRSLALTVYGDLDLSVMDEMPPGRQEIDTYVLTPDEHERVYALIRKQIKLGRQVFIIYPLVEESESTEAKAAVEEREYLQNEIFPDLKIGLLHGRLKPDEKDYVMAAFRDKEYDILVSTSVVEVGVDVPNATVMVIEGANRFGLAQLHQFRGRVGRGTEKSYCILIPDSADAVENERLSAMLQTNDGFKLAEIDLEQRGPGDFLGTRQSGFADLRMASLTDVHLIEKARQFAQKIFQSDPEFTSAEHQLIHQTMGETWRIRSSSDVS